jgi:hypothetical protein
MAVTLPVYKYVQFLSCGKLEAEVYRNKSAGFRNLNLDNMEITE